MPLTCAQARIILAGFWLLILGYLPAYAMPLIDSVEPAQIAAHKSAQLQIKVSDWPLGASLALSPGGPYLKKITALQSPARDMAMHNNRLFVAEDAGVTVYDSATLNPIFRTSSLRCSNIFINSEKFYCMNAAQTVAIFAIGAKKLEAIGVFVNDSPFDKFVIEDEHIFLLQASALRIVDIHDPNTPLVISTLPLATAALDLTLHQDRLYLANGKDGVMAVDVRDKTMPIISARYATNGAATQVRAKGNNLYVGDNQTGLTVLEIRSDKLQWRGSHNAVGRIRLLRIDDEKVVVLNESGTLILLDITNPTLPTISASVNATPGTSIFFTDGSDIFAVDGETLSHFDASSTAPTLSNENLDLGQGVNFGGQRKGFIDGTLLYVADWFSGLHIYDIVKPEQPVLLSSYHTPGSSKGVVVSDGYAFVADDDHGLQIIDVHVPTAPQFIAELQTKGLAYTPKLDGKRLYLASHRGGVQIIDVSNVAAPKLLGEFMTGDKAWSIDIKNNLAYVANAESGLMIFDVKNPADVNLVGQFNPGGDAEDVIVRDNYAFVTFFDQGLHIVDITDPSQPKSYGHITTPGNARGIELYGNVAYVADWFAGMHAIDISALNAPTITRSYDTSGASWGMRVKGNFLYLFDWWGGLLVLNAEDMKFNTVGRYPHGEVTMLRAQDDYLYAAHGSADLQIFDIKNPLNPTWMTGIDLLGVPLDLALSEDYAYVAMGAQGVAIVNIRNPFQSRLLSTLATGGNALSVRIDGKDRLWVRRDTDALRIDISNPLEPRVLDIVANGVRDMWTDSGVVYLAGDGGLVAHVNNSKQIVRYAEFASSVRAHQNIVCIYAPGHGISVLDFNQESFTHLSRLEIDHHVVDFQIKDRQLIIALANFEVRSYDLSQPTNPRLLSLYNSIGRPLSLITHRLEFYLAASNGIIAINPIPKIATNILSPTAITFSVPPLPDGWYDLAIVQGDDVISVRRNGLRATGQRFSKPKITQEQFQKLLREKTQEQRPK